MRSIIIERAKLKELRSVNIKLSRDTQNQKSIATIEYLPRTKKKTPLPLQDKLQR